VHQEYHVKEKKDEPVPMQVDFEKAPAADVVQAKDSKIKTQDAQKGPMTIEKSVDSSQKLVLANDHEASSCNLMDQDKEKYFQPRWYPQGLTHTQKRRLQRLRRQEQKKKEAEKMRDEQFDKYRPRIPQGKAWQVKAADQPTGPVGPLQPTGLTGVPDRSDRSEQPDRPANPKLEQKAEESIPTLAPGALLTLANDSFLVSPRA
jgi:hypothetical protein